MSKIQFKCQVFANASPEMATTSSVVSKMLTADLSCSPSLAPLFHNL